jgi:hypothetical protein
MLTGLSLDDPQGQQPLTSQEQLQRRSNTFLNFAKRLDVILIVLLLVGGALFYFLALRPEDPDQSASNAAKGSFATVEIPLGELLEGRNLTLTGAPNVTINGSLQLSNGLTVAPTLQPTGARAGQIYYDQGTNQLGYFNGEVFVFLTSSDPSTGGVQSLGGVSGQLTLGDGITIAGNQLGNSGVITVQGQSGDVTFTAGPGLVINGTNFSNSGVISVAAGTPNVTVTNDGSGNVTVSVEEPVLGTGTVTSSGGTAGSIPLFTGAQNIEDSIITQSGLTVTISGDLNIVTGGLSLSNALTVSNGGTGTASLAANGVLVGQGTGAITSVTAGGLGLCLLSTAGAPTWAACPSAAGVNSLNGLSGALNIANASGAGSTITIDDASTITKGIASFNGTNFTAAGGVVNTIQNIHTAATPTFAGVNTNTITPNAALTVGVSAQTALLQGSTTTITSNGVGNNIVLNSAATIELQDNTNVTGSLSTTGDLAVNGGDITSSGALNITPGGALTIGATGQTLTLQGGAATSFSATSGANTTTVGFTTPIANTTLNFPALAAGTYTICTTSGNCSGAATTLQAAYDNSTNPEIVLDATRGALTIRDMASPLGANLLEVQNNAGSVTYLAVSATGVAVTGTATVSGNVNTTGGALQTNGTTRIDNAGNATNIGTLTLSGAISGGTSYTGSGNINTTGGTIQTNSTTRIDNSGNLINIADVTASGDGTFQGGGMTLGTTSQAGTLVLNDGSANTGTLQVAALGQNSIYILPDAGVGSATICLDTGNCAGIGGGVTTPGGTPNTVPKFTAGQTIGDSNITDDGTTVGVGVALSVTGNSTFTGDLALNGGDLTSTGALNITPGGALTLGSTTQTALLQGSTTTITSNGAGNDIVLTSADQIRLTGFDCTIFANGGLLTTDASGNLACANDDGGGAAPTFQSVYDSSNPAAFTLNGTNGGLVINDNVTPIGASLFRVQSSGAVTTYLDVTSTGVGVGGALNVSGNTTLTGDLAVNGGDITSTGALNITPGGTLTVGATGQQLILQGDATTQLTATDGGNTTSFVFETPAADVTYRLPTAAAGNYDLCTTAGNCVGTGGGVTTSGGSANRLAKFSGAQSITDSSITDTGTLVTTSSDLIIQGGDVTIGVANTQTGTINMAHSSSAFLGSLIQGALTGNRTYTLPDISGTICLTTGNCAGPGSANTLQAAYDAGATIATSDSRDLAFTLANTATDSNFTVSVASGSTGTVIISRANGGGAADPAQLLLVENQDADRAQPVGVRLQAATGGGMTTAIDASDADITNALDIGANNIVGTTGNITLDNFSVTGASGNVTGGTYNGQTITSAASFTGTVTVLGGTVTVGAASQAGNLVLHDGTGFTGTLEVIALGQNTTYTLPDPGVATATICLSTGNCAGTGGGVTTGGGTTNTVPIFTGPQTIGDSIITQSGSTVNIAGSLTLANALGVGQGGTGLAAAPTNGQLLIGNGTGYTLATLANNGGLTITNGAGSIGLAVNYGAVAATAVQGDTTLICPSGTGNLTGGGNSIVLGAGGTCGALNTVNNPTFSTSVTTPIVQNAGLTLASTGANSLLLQTNGSTRLTIDSAGDMTATGNLSLQGGGLNLGTTSQTGSLVLNDGNGQTTTFQAGNSTGDLTFILPTNTGVANQCLKQSGTGNQLIWQDCDGGAGGSSATLQTTYDNSLDPEIVLNSSVGGLSIRDNATPLGTNLLEIQSNDGSVNYFSIDTTGANVTGTFTATGNINTTGALQTSGTTRVDASGNLINIGTVTAGTYNGQTISSAANFTGSLGVAGNTTLAGDLAINGGDLTSSGALNITPGGTLTVGVAGQQLILQGNANTQLTATGGGFTTTVGFTGTPTGATTYNFDRAAAAGTYNICTTVGNCAGVGGGVTTAGGTTGTLAKFTGAQTLGDSLLSESGSVVTVNGNLNLVTGNQYQVNGTQISSADLSNDANLAKLSASQTFTGNTVAFQNAANSTNAFNVQNQAGNRILAVDSSNAQVILGQAGVLDGSLVFENVTNSNTVTILPGAPTANRTLTLPDASGILCTDSGNCAGAGATLQTSYNFSVGGTTPKIKVNDTLLGVDIQDADTTIAANLFNVRASNAAGLGTVMFGVGNTGAATMQNSVNSTSAFRLLTQGGTSVLTGDTTNGRIILGQSNTLNGTLAFNNAANANAITIVPSAATGARTITLPDETGTVCLQSSTNCGFALSAGSNNYIQNGTTLQTANFYIQSASASSVGGIIRGASGQTSSLLQMLDGATGFTIAQFSNNGYLMLGSDSIPRNGQIVIHDNTTSNTNTVTLTVPTALTGARTITLPDETGTVCLQGLASCGFALSSGSGNYIQNQNASAQTTANFWISGTGRTDTSMLAPAFDSASGALTVGATNASAITLGNASSTITTTIQGQALVKSLVGGDSATAFQVQNSLTNSIFAVDTATSSVSVGDFDEMVELRLTGDITWGAVDLETPQGFEGSFLPASPGTWTSGSTGGGSSSWARSTAEAQGGTASAASGTTVDNGTSWMDLNYTFAQDGKLSFYWKIDSEEDFDYMLFCYDNDSCTAASGWNMRTSGDVDWLRVSIPVTAGAHSFRWVYDKDGSDLDGADRGWVDNVQFTAGNGTGTIRADSLTLDASDNITLKNSANDNAILLDTDGEVQISTVNSTSAFRIVDTNGNSLMNIDSEDSMASLLGQTSGSVAPWATDSDPLTSARYGSNAVTVNGYVYVIGGSNASNVATDTVYYAKINSDGSLGAWTTGVSLPATRTRHSMITSNGHIYVIGGESGGTPQTTVYYARVNTDGAVGPWRTGLNPLPAARARAQVTAINGYVYVIGGHNGTAMQSTVYYAGISPDGGLGVWVEDVSNPLPETRGWGGSVTANGYIYVLGGDDAGVPSTDVYYAKAEVLTGVGSWQLATSSLPSGRIEAMASVMNGHIYLIGGNNSGYQSTVYHSKIGLNGAIGTWGTDTDDPLPAARGSGMMVTANGYIYAIGGFSGSAATDTVYYASTSRVQIGASLDLVGLQGQNLAEGGSNSAGSVGGSITAGNGMFVGGLQVVGEVYMGGNLGVGAGLSVAGGITNGGFDFKLGMTDQVTRGDSGLSRALVKNTGNVLVINFSGDFTGGTRVDSPLSVSYSTNSTTAFQVIGGGSVPRFVVDTTNSRVYIGSPTSDAVGALLVLDTKDDVGSTTADPTGIAGAMYYNADTKAMRCYENGAWKDCTGPTRVSKIDTEDIVNDATLTNDAQLTFPMEANVAYQIRCQIFYATGATPDFKYALTGPTSAGLRTEYRAIVPGLTGYQDVTINTVPDTVHPLATTGGQGSITIESAWTNGATPGAWAFQWAQNASNAATTSVIAGSYCDYMRYKYAP